MSHHFNFLPFDGLTAWMGGCETKELIYAANSTQATSNSNEFFECVCTKEADASLFFYTLSFFVLYRKVVWDTLHGTGTWIRDGLADIHQDKRIETPARGSWSQTYGV